jgi:hypothetical protein
MVFAYRDDVRLRFAARAVEHRDRITDCEAQYTRGMVHRRLRKLASGAL